MTNDTGAVGAETMTAGRIAHDAAYGLKPDSQLWQGQTEGVREFWNRAGAAVVSALASPRADSDERTAGEAEPGRAAFARWSSLQPEFQDRIWASMSDDVRAFWVRQENDQAAVPAVGVTPWKSGQSGYAREALVLDAESQALEVAVTTAGRIDLIVHNRAGDGFDDLTARMSRGEAGAVVAALIEAGAPATPAQPAGAVPDSLRALSEAVREYGKAEWSAGYATGSYGEGPNPDVTDRLSNVLNSLSLLLASHPAGQSAGSGAGDFSGKFWLHLKEPRRVPERKGPFRSRDLAKTLREFMAARPQAYISVVTVDYDGPEFEDGPQALQATDGRSMSTGSKHIQRVRAAHGDHSDLTAPDSTRTGQGEETRDLIEAARPFSACVFNDNGDVSISTGRLDTSNWLRLDRALSRAEATLAARPAAPEAQGACIEDTADETANALRNCAEAVAFFDQVKASSSAEQAAVGADHWNWIEAACRRAAKAAPPASSGQEG